MGDRRPALWRLAGASLVDAAPAVALMFVTIRPLLNTAAPAPDAAREPDAEQGPSAREAPGRPALAKASRRMQRGLLAYNWLEVALICVFGRTQGMALLGLKLTRPGGAAIGTTRAFARVFGPDHLVRLVMTPLRSLGPTAQGGASLALGITNAAAALADSEHRTLWDRLAATRVVRA